MEKLINELETESLYYKERIINIAIRIQAIISENSFSYKELAELYNTLKKEKELNELKEELKENGMEV